MTIPIGGQAVIEGVMFKSENLVSVSVRNNKGKIITTSRKFKSITKKNKLLALPFIRGVVNLVEMLKLGVWALDFSSKNSEEDETVSKGESFFTITLSILIAIGLFVVLPLFLSKTFFNSNNIADGLFRLVIFLGYLFLISLLKDVRRVFEYHGAEHAVINCYEDLKDEKKVTPKKAIKYSTIHPRCGTSFLFLVLFVSIIVFSLFNFNSFLIKTLSRIILLPVVAGISYEILKYSAKKNSNFLVKLLVSPGLLLQKITTKKPDLKELEVAITSFKKHF